MKLQIPTTKEVNITRVRLALPVRYDDEDIPYDFPLRDGEMWTADVDIDTGKIHGWPKGQVGHIRNMKVCDGGVYVLYDDAGNEVARREDYVPHGLVPGEYGDYVSLKIDETGTITNWPKNPKLSAFFDDQSED